MDHGFFRAHYLRCHPIADRRPLRGVHGAIQKSADRRCLHLALSSVEAVLLAMHHRYAAQHKSARGVGFKLFVHFVVGPNFRKIKKVVLH